jgi:site-specific recombinase XerD
LVNGFLFSLQTDGKTVRTYEYYSHNLRYFLDYVKSHDWPDKIHQIESQHIREFLSYIASRTYTHGAGNGIRSTADVRPLYVAGGTPGT